MKPRHSILGLLALLPLSCAPDAGKTQSSATPSVKPFSERINESNGYRQDAEGNWKPRTDKRSPFENQGESAYYQGEYGKKEFNAAGYSKKSWWGNKNYDSAKYAGKTDGGRFQQSFGEAGKGAPEAGKAADMSNAYKTGGVATGAARESGTDRIKRPTDAETDYRRERYEMPEIIDWRQQRSLSLEQSKGILGR